MVSVRRDAEQRRTAIADAVGRVLARTGVGLPGMREIAAEAGVTTGALQHHFRNKDEMLLFAMEHHGRRWTGRLQARAAAASGPPQPRRVLRAIVEEFLPLDAERAVESRVAAVFVVRAAGDPALAALYRQQYTLLRRLVAGQLRVAGTADPDGAADELLCLVDGLRTQILLAADPPAAVLATLDRVLDRLLS